MWTGPPQGPTSLLPLREGSSLEAGSEVEIIKGGFLQSAFASTFVKGRARKEWAEGEAELLSVSTEVSADPTRSSELSPTWGKCAVLLCRHIGGWMYLWMWGVTLGKVSLFTRGIP